MSGPRFTTPDAERCFEQISSAAEGFENLTVYEAAGVLLAQVIASGSFDVAGAQEKVFEMVVSMSRDIAANWPAVIAQRKRARQ
jgi:chorismate mutase